MSFAVREIVSGISESLSKDSPDDVDVYKRIEKYINRRRRDHSTAVPTGAVSAASASQPPHASSSMSSAAAASAVPLNPTVSSEDVQLSSALSELVQSVEVPLLPRMLPFMLALVRGNDKALPRVQTRPWMWTRVLKPILAQPLLAKAHEQDLEELILWAWENDDPDTSDGTTATSSTDPGDSPEKPQHQATTRASAQNWSSVESDVILSALPGSASPALVNAAVLLVRCRPRSFFLYLLQTIPTSLDHRAPLLSFLNRFLRLRPSFAHYVVSTNLLILLVHIPLLDTDVTCCALSLSALSIILPRVPSALDPYLPALFSAYLCLAISMHRYETLPTTLSSSVTSSPTTSTAPSPTSPLRNSTSVFHHINKQSSSSLYGILSSYAPHPNVLPSSHYLQSTAPQTSRDDESDPISKNTHASTTKTQTPLSSTPNKLPQDEIHEARLQKVSNDALISLSESLRQYFTVIYGLFPCSLLAYFRQPSSWASSSLPLSLPDNLRQPLIVPDSIINTDPSIIRTVVKNVLSFHTIHPNFIQYHNPSEEVNDKARWLRSEAADVVAECERLYIPNNAAFLQQLSPPPLPSQTKVSFSNPNSRASSVTPNMRPVTMFERQQSSDSTRSRRHHQPITHPIQRWDVMFSNTSKPPLSLKRSSVSVPSSPLASADVVEQRRISDSSSPLTMTENTAASAAPVSNAAGAIGSPSQTSQGDYRHDNNNPRTEYLNYIRGDNPASSCAYEDTGGQESPLRSSISGTMLPSKVPDISLPEAVTSSVSSEPLTRESSTVESQEIPSKTDSKAEFNGKEKEEESIATANTDMSSFYIPPIPQPHANSFDVSNFENSLQSSSFSSGVEGGEERGEDLPSSATTVRQSSEPPLHDESTMLQPRVTSSSTSSASSPVHYSTSSPKRSPLPRAVSSAGNSAISGVTPSTTTVSQNKRASPSAAPIALLKGSSTALGSPSLGGGQESTRSHAASSAISSKAPEPSVATTATTASMPHKTNVDARSTSHDEERNELIAALEKENMLLKNSLNYEIHLRAQHNQHLGTLHREHISQSGAEAERQTLYLQLRSLRDQHSKALASLERFRSESATSKAMRSKWENELSSRLISLREQKRNWNSKKETLEAELESAKEILSEQNKKLVKAEVDMWEMNAQRELDKPKLNDYYNLEEKVEGFKQAFLAWDEDWSKYEELKEKMLIVVSELRKGEIRRETLEKNLAKAIDQRRDRENLIEDLSNEKTRLLARNEALENLVRYPSTISPMSTKGTLRGKPVVGSDGDDVELSVGHCEKEYEGSNSSDHDWSEMNKDRSDERKQQLQRQWKKQKETEEENERDDDMVKLHERYMEIRTKASELEVEVAYLRSMIPQNTLE